jgi:S1-C subfamily serine protease
VAADPKIDLALLKIPELNFPTLPIVESRKISVMDSVVAMAFPMYSTIGYDVLAGKRGLLDATTSGSDRELDHRRQLALMRALVRFPHISTGALDTSFALGQRL